MFWVAYFNSRKVYNLNLFFLMKNNWYFFISCAGIENNLLINKNLLNTWVIRLTRSLANGSISSMNVYSSRKSEWHGIHIARE